jgi:DNA-binding MarR family transcriptional regulator
VDVQRLIPANLRPPATARDLDIDIQLIEDLFLRRGLRTERSSIRRVANEIGVSPSIVTTVFDDLRSRQYLDVLKLDGNDYHYSLTERGRDRAEASYNRCAYSGIAPVSLARYQEICIELRADVEVNSAIVNKAFSDLVLPQRTIDRIGPAFAAQQSIFFYGPSGTGKTSLSERLVRMYNDWIVVPHAVEIDGSIITVFDPTLHNPVANQPAGFDPRWVVCERPLVIAGGELELSMLQLKRDPISKVYSAPLQMKANNGVLLIDDFGRQLIQPGALLNRWIVPLERRIDYLSLDSGLKFAIPFEVLVVFSTNLDPARLGDDAFFRRIQNKIFVGATTTEEFDSIVEMAADRFGLHLESDSAWLVRTVCREFGRSRLYPTYPHDLFRIVKSICDYERAPYEIDRARLWQAAELYFTVGSSGDWNDDHGLAASFTAEMHGSEGTVGAQA